MQITIRNNAQLRKKYLRFIKWKLNKLKRKFKHLLYVEVFIKSEGQSPKTYITNVRLGVTGHDILIQNKSENLGELFSKTTQSVHRYLAKNKSSKTNRRKENVYLNAR